MQDAEKLDLTNMGFFQQGNIIGQYTQHVHKPTGPIKLFPDNGIHGSTQTTTRNRPGRTRKGN